MLKLFQPKRPSILGMDISGSSISLLGISGSNQELCVEGYARAVLPPHILDGALIKDLDSLALAIKKIHKDSGLASKKVALALPDSQVIKHLTQLPSGLTELEMEELILIELEQLLSYPADKISFDFELLGASPKNPSLLEVSVLAARKEHLAKPMEAITRAGLRVRIVDVHSYAVQRAIEPLLNQYQAKVLALIDLGKGQSHLFVFYEKKLIFSREEQSATLRIMNPDNRISGAGEEVFQQPMVSKIKGHLQFFYSSNPQYSVDFILIAGEAIRADQEVYVQEQLKIRTEIANPLRGMAVKTKIKTKALYQDAPALMAVCGLALRSIKQSHERH